MLINQSSLINTIPSSLITSTDQLLPPVPPRIRERMIKGEYIDITTLLLKTMFSSSLEFDSFTSFTVQLLITDQSTQLLRQNNRILFILNGDLNIYLVVCIDHMPSQAPSLIPCQRIITSANTLHPLESWLDYDMQF